MTNLIPIFYGNHIYAFNKYLGTLMCYDKPCKIQEQYHVETYRYVENPYLLSNRSINTADGTKPSFLIRCYARFLVAVCQHFFILTNLILRLRIPVYENAGVANEIFYQLFPYERQRQLCLARAVFTATLSVRFRYHGALFIGAFLPTTQMHAWVIEDGMHADAYDTIWLQYRPVLEFEWKRKLS